MNAALAPCAIELAPHVEVPRRLPKTPGTHTEAQCLFPRSFGPSEGGRRVV